MSNLKQLIETADLDDDGIFTSVVQQATSELAMSARDLASLMRISVPTAQRWMNGVTTPHVGMRGALRRGLLSKLERT